MRRLVVLFAMAVPLAAVGQDGGGVKQESLEEMRAKVLARINHFRKIAGVDAVVEDPKLSAGCQKHAEYIRKNVGNDRLDGAGAHREEKELPGYTEEGAKSAARSVVWEWRAERPIDAGIDKFVATLFHRAALLSPRLTSVGIGLVHEDWKVLVVDTLTLDMKKPLKEHPVVYPVPEQKDVPLVFSLGGGEWPDPRPDPKREAGYPITLQFAQLSWQPGSVRASLRSGDKETDCWISTPDAPACADYGQEGIVCILPKDPLAPNTKYVVAFECKQHGVERTPTWTKTWSFITEAAKDRKPDRR